MMEVQTIVRYLEEAPAPVSRTKLSKDLRLTAKLADAHLSEAVRSGAAFQWPRLRGAARYWHRDPAVLVREEVLNVATATALTRRELVRAILPRAHDCGTKIAQSTVRALLQEGRLRSEKIIGPALCYRTDRPQALVEASYAALRQRLGRLGIGDAEMATADISPADALFDQIVLLQPAPGVPVTVRSLRAAMPGMSKAEFDAAVLSLADQQRIYLTTHDHGWALPEAERQELVWDGGQKLYVAVTLRD